MANSLDDNYFWKLRLQSQQAVQKQQMDELDATAPVPKKADDQKAKNPLSIAWKGDDGKANGADETRPALTLPSTQAAAIGMELTKLLALFRNETLEKTYNSNQTKIEANSLITHTKNLATMSLVLNSVASLSGLLNYSAAAAQVANDSQQAVEAAKKKGLENQQAELDASRNENEKGTQLTACLFRTPEANRTPIVGTGIRNFIH